MASGGSVDDTPDQHGITEQLVALFLRRYLSADSRPVVKSYQYRPLASLGEGYTTVRKVLEIDYRDEATAEDGQAVFVVKVPGGAFSEEIAKWGLYEREVVMYSAGVEFFRRLLSRRHGGQTKLPFARFVYGTMVKDGEVRDDSGALTADQTQKEMVVLELLQNYEVVDKKAGFDLAHLRLVIPAMARFHATGYVLHQRHQDKVERLRTVKMVFPEEMKEMNTFLSPIMAVVEHAGMMEEAAALGKMLTFEKFTAGWESTFTEDRDVVTLVHGDLWSSNMMFRYQTDSAGVRQPVDIKFVDLQMSRFGDLAFDLVYCLISSTRGDTRRGHLKELLRWYEVAFRAQLEELGEYPDKMVPWLSVDKLYAMFGSALERVSAQALQTVMFLHCSEEDRNTMMSTTDPELSKENMRRIRDQWRQGGCSSDLAVRILEFVDDLKEFNIV